MAQLTFPVTAGVLVRGQFRRALKEYCFARHYTLSIDEDKGLLESLFSVTIDVPDSQIEQAKRELQNWFKELNRR